MDKFNHIQDDSMSSTGKAQPSQEVNAEPVDKLTTRVLNKEDNFHDSLGSFIANSLNVTTYQ